MYTTREVKIPPIKSFKISGSFRRVKVVVDPQPFPRTFGARQEQTVLHRTPGDHRVKSRNVLEGKKKPWRTWKEPTQGLGENDLTGAAQTPVLLVEHMSSSWGYECIFFFLALLGSCTRQHNVIWAYLVRPANLTEITECCSKPFSTNKVLLTGNFVLFWCPELWRAIFFIYLFFFPEAALAIIISGVWVNVPVFSLLTCQHDWRAFWSRFIQKPWLISHLFPVVLHPPQ